MPERTPPMDAAAPAPPALAKVLDKPESRKRRKASSPRAPLAAIAASSAAAAAAPPPPPDSPPPESRSCRQERVRVRLDSPPRPRQLHAWPPSLSPSAVLMQAHGSPLARQPHMLPASPP